MRKYLFVDNFRGFDNTFVPILDVNFLVGENSTGKTSFLALLKLIASQRIMLHHDFGDEDVNFGNFGDMVSAHSEDRTYFTIGIAQEVSRKDKHKEIGVTAAFLTYEEHEGLPRLARFTATLNDREISLKFDGGTVWYRASGAIFDPDLRIDDVVRKIMPRWRREHATPDLNYQKLVLPSGMANAPGLAFPLSWVLNKIAGETFRQSGGIPLLGADFGPDFVWVAPIRTKPRRTYDELRIEFSAEGLHTPYLIRRILNSKSDAGRFLKSIKAVGAASGLFQSVDIRKFGDDVTAPFEVDIVLDHKALNLSTVGYGVSQSLPVLVELFWREKGSWFAVQQPEVHLHPRAQAALGDVLFELAVTESKRFLIETHSDFTIDRFRMNYRKRSSKKPSSQILFFERKHRHNTVRSLKISPRGELPSTQPRSYRQFFLKEDLRLLGL
jgi:predicted ATPase